MKNYRISQALALLAFCIPFLFSCTDGKKNGVAEIDVDIEVSANPSDFFDGYRTVVLETSDSCLISDIRGYAMEGDLITIRNRHEVFTFDINTGKLKCMFKKEGEGPEEYLEMRSLRLHNRLVYILDGAKRAIIAYEPDGKFVRKINLDNSYIDFQIANDKEMILASGNSNDSMHEFTWIDSETGEVKSRAGEFGIRRSYIFDDYVPFAGKQGEDFIVNVPFILTQYKLGECQLDTFANYKFNTPEQLPELTLETVDLRELSELTRNKPMVRQLGYYCETPTARYQSFELFMNDFGFGKHIVRYDRDGKVIGQIRFMAEEFDEFPYLSGRRLRFYEGQMVDIVDAHALLYRDGNHQRDTWAKQGITEDSNPVLFFYKLK